ncbi:hypothetical protein ACWDUL_20215 [Nocardia niigatensis]
MTADNYDGWFDLPAHTLLRQISHTAPDQPPGAIAAVAITLAAAAALARKSSTDPAVIAELDTAVTQSLRLAVRDGHAYDAWKGGDSASAAVERYPRELAELAAHVAELAAAMPPSPITELTDIHTAEQLARGCVAAATAVVEGNANHAP